MASSGKYTREQIKNITKATAEWSAATGKSASQIIAEFDKIASDPVKGLEKLNEQYNFLEKGQLTYIDTLSRTKGETEAVSEATKLFAEVMEKRMKSIADNATPLEKCGTILSSGPLMRGVGWGSYSRGIKPDY